MISPDVEKIDGGPTAGKWSLYQGAIIRKWTVLVIFKSGYLTEVSYSLPNLWFNICLTFFVANELLTNSEVICEASSLYGRVQNYTHGHKQKSKLIMTNEFNGYKTYIYIAAEF